MVNVSFERVVAAADAADAVVLEVAADEAAAATEASTSTIRCMGRVDAVGADAGVDVVR